MDAPEAGTESTPGGGPPDTGRPRFPLLHVDPNRLVKRLVIVWVAIGLALLLLDCFLNYAGVHVVEPIRRLANLGHESSLANLVAVLQMVLLALTCWAARLAAGPSGQPIRTRRGWLLVAIFFTYLAIDDGARVHERIGTAAEMVLDGWAASRGAELVDYFPSYAWQLVVLPLIGILGVAALLFLWQELRPRHSRLLIASGLACFAVAVGLDFLEGLKGSHALNPYTWILERIDLAPWTRATFHKTPYVTLLHFSKALEELLEIYGTTLIWVAVLRHWMRSIAEFRIRFADS